MWDTGMLRASMQCDETFDIYKVNQRLLLVSGSTKSAGLVEKPHNVAGKTSSPTVEDVLGDRPLT